MITIKNHQNKFKVVFSAPGTGTRAVGIIVPDVETVHALVDHYFFREHDREKCPACTKKEKNL